jgi:hypothetical protein
VIDKSFKAREEFSHLTRNRTSYNVHTFIVFQDLCMQIWTLLDPMSLTAREFQNEMEATENWSPIALRLVFHIPIPARLSGWGN